MAASGQESRPAGDNLRCCLPAHDRAVRVAFRRIRRGLAAAALGLCICAAGGTLPLHAANDIASGPASRLPIPRFVSLKADRVNVRIGPTKNHEVGWVYTRAGLPVEITAEFENWRRVRDWEGAEGWVYHALLSGRRTAVVQPKVKDELVPLHASADAASRVTAQLQAGVLGSVSRCTGAWCRFAGEKFDGWIAQERLWGVYPNEKID